MPVRLGVPQNVRGMGDVVCNPIYSTGVGLLSYGRVQQLGRHGNSSRVRGIRGLLDRMKSWFQGNF
jgi:cell division protein FtsA